MLHISLEHLQLQAGVSWPVLSKLGHLQHKYLDPCYLTNTWEFLDSINSHIWLEPNTWIRPQPEGDSFIMEDLANLPGLKPIELVHAQRCRLFLGVTTLADTCTSNGIEICVTGQSMAMTSHGHQYTSSLARTNHLPSSGLHGRKFYVAVMPQPVNGGSIIPSVNGTPTA
jgi:hypothetical protein